MKLKGIKNKIYLTIITQGTWLILSLIMMFLNTGSAKAKSLIGCYANKDATGSYFLVLLPQGKYKYYVRTSLNQRVTSMGTWWQKEESVFTKITISTIRDQFAVSRLVDGSVQQLSIQDNGNLVNDSKTYHPVNCSQVTVKNKK